MHFLGIYVKWYSTTYETMTIGFERNFIKAPCAKEILFLKRNHSNPTNIFPCSRSPI
jgi:hypothetical protein